MTEDQAKQNGNEAQAAKPRVGVYICHCGGNISDVVDVERVVEAAAKMPDVVIARRNMFMCSDPGQGMIEQDIKDHDLNRVVVSACSPSLHELTFRGVLNRAGINPYLFENANLREQVSWVSKGDPDGATQKAIRLVGAAVAKARLLQPLDPIHLDAIQRAVIIGGGLTGLRCALDLARLELDVTLIEAQPFLGGHLAELGKIYPSGKPAHELLSELIREVSAHPRIDIHTSAEVIEASGCISKFTLKVRTANGAEPEKFNADRISADLASRAHGPNGDRRDDAANTSELDVQAGVIVLATGFDHYTPSQGEYAFGEHPSVITLPDLIRELETGEVGQEQLKLNGRPVRSVGFIHCVGSRELDGVHDQNEEGRELNHYCSRVCCTSALWTALQLRERYPELTIYDIHKDIRTYGRGHEDIYEDAAKAGVIFCRYEAETPPKVAVTQGDSPLTISLKDDLTFNEEIDVPVDLVVLVTGLVPHAIDNLVDMLKLPRSADQFLQEVHPKLRPVEMAVNGVFIAGCCQAPLDSVESSAAASAAAAKVAAILGKGYIEREPFVARVDHDLCEGTGACVEECKYNQAVSLVETDNGKKAVVNAAICCGCGMCAAVCPTGAIQVDGWRLDQFDAMIDALLVEY